MIDFPIVDAHLHIWDQERLSYPWLNSIPMLNRSFSLEEYNQACGPLNVEKIVFMECGCDPESYREEVRMVTELALHDPRIQGIVSYAPVEKGTAVRSELEALKQNPLVKGVRKNIQSEQDLAFCCKPDFINGVQLLADFDFTFDLCIDYRHNRNVIELVKRCPDVQFIIDHIGKPNIKEHRLDPWREEMRELSRYSNVYCKVSSLATEADHEQWTLDDIRPYAEHILDCFGCERMVYASDWPVSSQAAEPPVCVEVLEQLLSGASKEQLRHVFYVNAIEFYGL